MKYYVMRGGYFWNQDKYFFLSVEKTKSGIDVEYLKKGMVKDTGGIDWQLHEDLGSQPQRKTYNSFVQFKNQHHGWFIYEVTNEEELFLKLL